MAEKEAQIDASNLKLDELELVDYLTNLGQWTADIVSKNRPKLDEILNNTFKNSKCQNLREETRVGSIP